jgi:uncharacterized protein (DUF169 family)
MMVFSQNLEKIKGSWKILRRGIDMKSAIAEAIKLETQPVAVVWTDKAPENAARFKSQQWGCVVSLFAAAAARGLSGAFDRQTFGCWGGGVGLGFGNQYEAFPGGMDCFCRFLSTGNEGSEHGAPVGEQMRAQGYGRMADDFIAGERYIKNPEGASRFVRSLPMQDIPAKFVVVRPLDQVDPEQDDIKNVTFFVDPDRLSALVILAGHGNPDEESVIIPWAAGCQVPGIYAYRELERERPRGLVGLTDITARRNVRTILGEHALSFTAPWPLFLEMESNVEGSFLNRMTWQSLLKTRS